MSGPKKLPPPSRARPSTPTATPDTHGAGLAPDKPPASAARIPTAARIHARGEGRLDLVLDFVHFVAKPMPLSLLLDEAPRRIAEIVGADVASLYLLEGEGGELVLRGNVGFPQGARGVVRLAVGEGITGMAVECMRPISVVQAPHHERYRAFPELDEDRYPVFLAVPVLGAQRALGPLLVQPAGGLAIGASDVDLIVALTAPIASGIRHAQLLDDRTERQQARRTGGGTRKVTLPGVPVVPGRALGAIAALRRPAAVPAKQKDGEDPRLLRTAFEVAGKALGALVTQAGMLDLSAQAGFLSTYLLMVSDSRLRERAFELVAKKHSVAQALGLVAREAARAANGIVGDPFLQDRARDIEDFCDALLMLASPDARAELPSKAVLLGDQVTVFDLLVSARAQPVGIALTERATGPRTAVLLKLMGVPSIVDVGGAFRWAAPGDVALVDADHGFLVINPSRAEVAAVRAARLQRSTEGGAGGGRAERRRRVVPGRRLGLTLPSLSAPSAAFVLAARVAGLEHGDALELREGGREAIPQPAGEDLARRVLQALDVVQVVVIKPGEERRPRVVQPLVVDEPARLLVHLARHRHLDAIAVTVQLGALVARRHPGQPVGGFEPELLHEADLHLRPVLKQEPAAVTAPGAARRGPREPPLRARPRRGRRGSRAAPGGRAGAA